MGKSKRREQRKAPKCSQPRTFNLEYQVGRHLESHLRQRPNTDPEAFKTWLVGALLPGHAWLWDEPNSQPSGQLDLF